MTNINKPGILFTRVLFILISGALSGTIVNALRPDGGIAWFYNWNEHMEARAREEGFDLISITDMRRYSESGEYIILDARPLPEYATGYIPGAMSSPYHEAGEQFSEIQLFLFPEQPVITYCSGLACDDALLLGIFLRDQGYTNVYMFSGGMEAWRAAGYPVEGGS